LDDFKNGSGETYIQGHCKIWKMKMLSIAAYKTNMAAGKPFKVETLKKEFWKYPSPNTADDLILKAVCSR
jgi:hypothetical protein